MVDEVNTPSQPSSPSPSNPASPSSQPVSTTISDVKTSQPAEGPAPSVGTHDNASLQVAQDRAQAAMAQVGNVLNKAGQTLTQKPAVPQAPTTMDERLWAALSYVPMVALISLLMKPASAFVKLHAKQGLTIFIVFFLSLFLYIIVPPLGALLAGLIQMALFVIGVYSLYMAFTGNWWKIPFINQVSDQLPVDIFTKVTTEAITGNPPPAPEDKSQTPQNPPVEKAQ